MRRHLVAVRWKDWRLYRKYEKDPWKLFNLRSDPREEKDVAASNPQVVRQLSAKHAAWVKTLAPLGKIPEEERGGGRVSEGHGWVYARVKKGDGQKMPE